MRKHNNNILDEIECILPDMNGIGRGKVLLLKDVMKGIQANVSVGELAIKLPETIFGVTLGGEFIDSSTMDFREPDLYLMPDLETSIDLQYGNISRKVVICDACKENGESYTYAPRSILKATVEKYREKNIRVLVAPELEFYLVPRPGNNTQSLKYPYGAPLAGGFDEVLRKIKECIGASPLRINTILLEGGAGQVEINVDPADPLFAADQVFMLKKIIKAAADTMGYCAVFMAKPFDGEPASALHIHQSLYDSKTGQNILVSKDGEDNDQLLYFIGGMQKYIPSLMPIFAPNVNSYRRFRPMQYAPLNVHWARENRTVGIRVPQSSAKNRRVENRVPGADVNPYLAIAASLLAGYLGLRDQIEPDAEMCEDASTDTKHLLPRHLLSALEKMEGEKALVSVFPETFIRLYCDLKEAEYGEFQAVNSAWENNVLKEIL